MFDIYTFFSSIISSNIYRYFNNIFHDFKVLKVITNKMLNVDFHDKFIKFWSVFFFPLFIYIYIYIYKYIYIYIYLYIYIYIYIYKQWKKGNTPKFDEFIMKVYVEHFVCNNLQDFKVMKNVVKIASYFFLFVLLKMMEYCLFIIFNFIFSRLLVIFLALGSRW